MKRKLLWIIAGLVVCALCIVAIVLLQKEDKHDHDRDDSETVQDSSSQSFHSSDMLTSREDIKSVTVTSGGESFTVTAGQGGDPYIKQLEGIKQNIELENALIELCKGLHAERTVEENADDLAKYGLKEPKGKGEIVYNDGTKASILVGDASPADERLFYAAVEGQHTVVLVEGNAYVYFTGKAKDYVSPVLSPAAQRSASESAKMTVSKQGADGLVLERSGESWSMSAPIKAQLDEQKSSGTVNGLYGLNAEYCEVIKPDDAAKAKYGLDKPAVTVTLKDGAVDITLKIGNAAVRNDESEKERYYCTIQGVDGTDCIYAVAKEYLPWVDITAAGLVSDIMLPNYLVNLKSIELTLGGKKHEYVITNEGGEADKINEDVSKVRTVKVTGGGREIDLAKFRELYEQLMKCPTNRIYTNDVKGDASISAVYHKNDGSADRLELVKTDEGFGARVNGQMSYLVDKAWADKLTAMIDALE